MIKFVLEVSFKIFDAPVRRNSPALISTKIFITGWIYGSFIVEGGIKAIHGFLPPLFGILYVASRSGREAVQIKVRLPLRAPVAQWIERIGSNDRVARSTRAGGTLRN